MIGNKKRWPLASLVCAVLWPAAVHGQSPELMVAYERFDELYAQGRYQEALPFAEDAARLVEEEFGPDHPNTATLLNNLAAVYEAQARYADAEPLYKRALAINEKALGPEHTDLAADLNNLAELYRAQGRYAQAEPLHNRALAIWEKALGP